MRCAGALAVAAGVGALVAQPALLTALTATGALYLAWMGVGLWRSPAAIGSAGDAEERRAGTGRSRGASVSGLNPKTSCCCCWPCCRSLCSLPSWLPVFAQIMAWARSITSQLRRGLRYGVGWGSQG